MKYIKNIMRCEKGGGSYNVRKNKCKGEKERER